MNKYLLLLSLLCNTALPQAQTDTVNSKISKVPFKRVDAIATFPQGDFKTYITRSLQINHTVEFSVKGQIILLMGIGADGSVAYVTVLKSLSPQIDPEVVRVVKSSPKWKPAMLNGQSTNMDMVLNIDMAVNGLKPLPPKVNKPTPVIAVNQTLKPTPVAKAIEPPVIKEPVIAKKVEPRVIKKPVPVVAKATPPVVRKPEPVIAKKVELPVVKKPAPVIIKKHEPVVAKKVDPPVVKKPTPVVAKVIPPVVKKPEPVVVKKAEPPVVKKPAPVVVKITPPVVKKTEPPIVKKSVPVVAKVTPPIIKKPLPVIAKKVEKTVIIPPVKPAVVAQAEPPVVKKKRVVIRQNLFSPSENNAHFPGGDQNLPAFLGSNIVYPQKAKDAGIEGRVILTFVVEEDGTVDDVEVVSSPSEDLSQEAIRVMLAMPKWKPAEQNKIKVAVTFTIPIAFKLTGKTTN